MKSNYLQFVALTNMESVLVVFSVVITRDATHFFTLDVRTVANMLN